MKTARTVATIRTVVRRRRTVGWVSIVFSVMWATAAHALGSEARWSELDEADFAMTLKVAAAKPTAEALAEVSRRFLGVSYQESPLGEGEGFDPDPPIRYDRVDCTTFVEQVLAMVVAGRTGKPAVEVLSDIRYSGARDYDHRNHIVEAQWIPHLIRAGYLQDRSMELARRARRWFETDLSPQRWRWPPAAKLHLEPAVRPRGTSGIWAIPAEEFQKIQASPDGVTVAVFVRRSQGRQVTRVAHMGFVFYRGRTAILRHASVVRRRVVDEPLHDYLARNAHRVGSVAVFSVSLGAVTDGQ